MSDIARMAASLGIDFNAIGPEIALLITASVLLLVDVFFRKDRAGIQQTLGIVGLLVAGGLAWGTHTGQAYNAFQDSVAVDSFSRLIKVVLCGATLLTFLLSAGYAQRREVESAEYFSLMILATLGMMLMASGTNLITIFLGLEISSISQYILAGMRHREGRSVEAALKYFILGAFATGFLLYGIALVYGATGSVNLKEIAFVARSAEESKLMLMAGCALILVGLGFKVSSVPFHMWTPDVYDGAPTSVTAFMAAGSKVAGFAALTRILFVGFEPLHSGWAQLVFMGAALTMTLGNVAALVQTRVKRMLAYSAIAHAGYLMVALVPGTELSGVGLIFYLVAYSLTNLGAFAVVALLKNEDDEGLKLSNLAGLGYRRPWLGAALAVFMFSLAGIPPTAGFAGKFYIFSGALESGYVGLAILGVLNSVISVYYYLRVIVWMYMSPSPQGADPVARAAWPLALALILTVVGVLQFGLFPGPLYELAKQAIAPLLG